MNLNKLFNHYYSIPIESILYELKSLKKCYIFFDNKDSPHLNTTRYYYFSLNTNFHFLDFINTLGLPFNCSNTNEEYFTWQYLIIPYLLFTTNIKSLLDKIMHCKEINCSIKFLIYTIITKSPIMQNINYYPNESRNIISSIIKHLDESIIKDTKQLFVQFINQYLTGNVNARDKAYIIRNISHMNKDILNTFDINFLIKILSSRNIDFKIENDIYKNIFNTVSFDNLNNNSIQYLKKRIHHVLNKRKNYKEQIEFYYTLKPLLSQEEINNYQKKISRSMLYQFI